MSELITTLPGGPSAPGQARAALADRFAGGVDPGCAETLKLLSSEVVTNCVQHAGAGDGTAIELRAWMLSGCVHVEVSTSAPSFQPLRERPHVAADRGRGLFLVDELSRSWGVVDNGRNTVWFKVAVG